MQQIQAEWEHIQGILAAIPGFDPKVLKPFYEEGPAKKGIHFFVIEYAPGEVIMAKGTTSDYAAVHLQGLVRVRDIVPAYVTAGPGCWQDPMARRLENLVLNEAATWPEGKPPGTRRLRLARPDLSPLPRLAAAGARLAAVRLLGSPRRPHAVPHRPRRAWPAAQPRRIERELSDPSATRCRSDTPPGARPKSPSRSATARAGQKPLDDRFLGITGTLWNQPRSVTLIADNDPEDDGKPCRLLLIKRKALEEIIKKSPAFYERKMADFVRTTLPDVLAKNRLFRDRLFAQDVRDWPTLLEALQGKHQGPCASWLHELRGQFEATFVRWLDKATAERLDVPEKFQIVERLNQALTHRALAEPSEWSTAPVETEAPELIARLASLNDCEVVRLNRLLLEAALPGVLASVRGRSR